MEISNYIEAELVVLIPVLYAVGMMLKGTEKINDKYIPVILTGCGIALSCLYIFFVDGITAGTIFSAIVQGILVTSVAVYGNQIVKQMTK